MNDDSAFPEPALSDDLDVPESGPSLGAAEAVQAWEQMARRVAVLLRESQPNADWLTQLQATVRSCRALAQRDPDAALYLLVQFGAAGEGRYSACHALLCALICELCAKGLSWPAAEIDSLVHAASTMNLSMTALQDALAEQADLLSPQQREQVDSHPQRSAALLEAAGVVDPLWLEVVRRHHDQSGAEAAPPTADQPQPAELLRRVDIYTAKLSSRTGREAKSPAIAARDTCLGQDGAPDRIGAAILRSLGVYPPGCFVQLGNGDVGVVIRRGPRAHTPVVAALRREDGWMYSRPAPRQTWEPTHAIVHGVTRATVRVRCDHRRNLDAV